MQYNSLADMLTAFPDERACVAHLERLRWPGGVECLHCGSERVHKRSRPGVYKCGSCRKEFSIRKHTIYEESKLPLRKWFIAAWLMSTSRKGISSYQLAREIGTTQKTAWFVLARLRKGAESANNAHGPLDGGP